MEKFSIISCKIKSLVTAYLFVTYYIDWSLFISSSARLSVLESHSSVVSIRFMCLCYSVTQIPFRTVTSPLLPLTSCHLAPSFSLYINNFRHFITCSILFIDIVSVTTCSKSPVFCYNRITIFRDLCLPHGFMWSYIKTQFHRNLFPIFTMEKLLSEVKNGSWIWIKAVLERVIFLGSKHMRPVSDMWPYH